MTVNFSIKKPHSGPSTRPGWALRLPSLLLLILALLASSCGKKAAPTLAAYERPPAPVLLRAVHRENAIIISWSYPGDKTAQLNGFTILGSSDKGIQRIDVPRRDRSFEETSFTYGKSYTFKVVARSLSGVLSNDSNAMTLTPLAPPPPPARLSYEIEADSVILSWESGGEGILYNVYRSFRKTMSTGKPLNKTPLSQNSFRDVFHVGRPVYYKVTALRNSTAEDEGAPSPEITIDPSSLVPPAPRDLSYFSAPGKVFLYWKEPYERWITGYRIYRKTKGHAYKLIGKTQVPTFLDKGGGSSERDYRVTAVGPSREGPAAEVRGVFFRRDDLQ